ncbi:flagellar biosynthesis protein FliQ [Larsenimonas rhizosphaerae]|uniref:Flagellar biosynthetic protein FliQ n=1 Tax=Larsenimonas rhizosphaerae TaxID=2944682 RepID=A0AA41ZD35_9GAMM|nr:flagellar biosynthesis protein FliQ [Larsenimonas rhizosphaerae]MCM2130407.1 flagellar biosynthesis protein FliQ [Larsenimonas rhizosphaerae]MCX2523112.1 flagellar biosynthesis protein FliQ [Larsenimonas rhizosphaerae]
MTPETVMNLAYQAMKLMLLLAAPLLLVALMVGLLVSLFQAATQINEMTLSFIPKILAVFLTLVVGGSWMIGNIVDFTRTLFYSIPQLISG